VPGAHANRRHAALEWLKAHPKRLDAWLAGVIRHDGSRPAINPGLGWPAAGTALASLHGRRCGPQKREGEHRRMSLGQHMRVVSRQLPRAQAYIVETLPAASVPYAGPDRADPVPKTIERRAP
jgi:hypothetical protein